MGTSQFDDVLRAAERRALVTVIQSHPEWTLGEFTDWLHRQGPTAPMRMLTFGELLGNATVPQEGSKPRERTTVEALAARVLELLERAARPVTAATLLEQLDCPRWKLMTTLRQLAQAGAIEREGVTKDTRYRRKLAEDSRPRESFPAESGPPTPSSPAMLRGG